MLELRRNTNEVCIILCDKTRTPIRPYDWYYHDPKRNINLCLDAVNEAKNKAYKEYFLGNNEQLKAYEAEQKILENDKKQLVEESLQEYIDFILNE